MNLFKSNNQSCEELQKEYLTLMKTFSPKDKEYTKKADIYFIQHNYPGRDFYKINQGENITIWKKEDYSITGGVGLFAKKQRIHKNPKEINIWLLSLSIK